MSSPINHSHSIIHQVYIIKGRMLSSLLHTVNR